MHICAFQIRTGQHCIRESSVGFIYYGKTREEVLGAFLKDNREQLQVAIDETADLETLGRYLMENANKIGVTIEETTEEEIQKRVSK